jgi:branched-chain amino acid transport system substrate-binding protein
MQQHGDTVVGKHIELVVKDGASSGETGRRLLQELIVNDKVDIIAGGLSAELLPSASLFTEATKPVVIDTEALRSYEALWVPPTGGPCDIRRRPAQSRTA